MLTWMIGDVRITRIVELEVPVAYHPKRPLIAAATRSTLVIGTQFPRPTAGRVRRDGDAYRFEV
jgi:hypothetical protein